MSPDLFNYYSELIIREVEKKNSILARGRIIINIGRRDDTVLRAETD